MVAAAIFAGCGSNSGSSATTVYDTVTPSVIPLYPQVLGGNWQTGVSPVFVNSSTSLFAGGAAGFSDYSSSAGQPARFYRPMSVASDGTSLYVADYYNNAVRQVEIATGYVRTLAGSIAGFSGSSDGVGTAAGFNLPSGITTDGTSLYVTDSGNFTIRKIDLSTKAVTTLAGLAGTAGSVDAVGAAARFNALHGITTDGISLFVTDSNNTIRRYDLASGMVTTVAGSPGTSGSADGVRGDARFNQPARVTTDGPNLYVTDFGNSTIRKIALATGVVSTIAGMASPGGEGGVSLDSTDGTGATARFNQPNGIACDGPNLYVTDSYTNRIRKIVLSSTTVFSGSVTTLATVGDVRLNSLLGIATDGVSLFVTDFTMDGQSHLIRRLQ